jgi:hypothetical protein
MMKPRMWFALGAGALAYLCVLYRFLSYTERNHLSGDTLSLFATIMLVVGLVVTLGAAKRRIRVATAAFAGVCIAHLIVMIVDCSQDGTRHNLGPIEFVLLGFYALPIYIGAAAANVVDRLRS